MISENKLHVVNFTLECFQNWQEMEFPGFRIFAFVVLTGSDVGVAVYQRLVQDKQTKVGYMAHLGGAVAGKQKSNLNYIKAIRCCQFLKVNCYYCRFTSWNKCT